MIHFAYKIPRHGSLTGRVMDKLALTQPWFPALWRHGKNIPWSKPVKQPHSITYNLFNALQKKDKVLLYEMYENRACHIKPGDKFLGQPINSWEVNTYKDPSTYKVVGRTLDKYPDMAESNKTIIMPYTHDPSYNLATKDLIERHGKNLIIISHKNWTDTWDQSPIKDYVDNLLRVNMGVNASDYPMIKETFNPKGKRKFLYVGNTNYYKNTKQLEAIAKAMPEFEGCHIGGGYIEGWKNVGVANLTSEYMTTVAREYDIFLNTSSADASPATIVEHMCFGFPIACTPESSYKSDTISELHVTDTKYNCEILNALQYTDEEVLRKRAKINREHTIKYHNWDIFCERIIDFVYNRPKDAHGLFLVNEDERVATSLPQRSN